MIKALFFMWYKDVQLRLTLIVIACCIVASAFIKDVTAMPLITMVLVFFAGTFTVNDVFSGSKCQVMFSVTPVGRSMYTLTKFAWADMWTLVFFTVATIVSITTALIRGNEIVGTAIVAPFVALLFAMLVNCISVPCVCLLPRRIGTVVGMLSIFVMIILLGVFANALAQEENTIMLMVDFFSSLNLFYSILLALCGVVLLALIQLLVWLCLQRAHLKQ